MQRDWTLGLLAVAQGVMWLAVVVYNITQVSFRQGLCPPALLGRMNATMRFLVWGAMPIGGVLGGLLGSAIGVRQTLFVVAVGGALTFLPVFLLAAADPAGAAVGRRYGVIRSARVWLSDGRGVRDTARHDRASTTAPSESSCSTGPGR